MSQPYANFPPDKLQLTERLARFGLTVRAICKRVGTHHHNVRPIVARLEAAGEVPTKCLCGQPRGAAHTSRDCEHLARRPRRIPKSARRRLPWQVIHELRRRLDAGQSGRSISRGMGLSCSTVAAHRRTWEALRSTPPPPCRCGRPARHPGGCVKNSPSLLSRDRRERIEQWAREGLSAAEMQRRSRAVTDGSGLETILKYARPVWAAMAAEGIVCGCGASLGHAGLCTATWESPGRQRGYQPIPGNERVRIANALLNGDPVLAIRRNVEVSEDKVLRVLRGMSRLERHKRTVIIRQRMGSEGARGHGIGLFARIAAAMPLGMDAGLRDDVVGELCLAVLEGRLTVDQIGTRASSFVSRGFAQWANAYGPRSLDEVLGDDDDRTRGDFVEDEVALAAFDEIMFGDEGGGE